MRKIKTWRDPYDQGWSTCRPKEIQLNPGVTILVGCNGAGKTTLLQNIKEELETEHVPFVCYDNVHNGGSNSISEASFYGDMSLMATMITSSEGELININVGKMCSKLRRFIATGEDAKQAKHKGLEKAFREAAGIEEEPEPIIPRERWILLDAADSGYSIDNVVELKQIFEYMQKDAISAGVDIYIVVSANAYELARGENCFDVMSGNYLTFNDYEDYRKFILKSSEKKSKRFKEN